MNSLKRPVGTSGTVMGHSAHCFFVKQEDDSGKKKIDGNDKNKSEPFQGYW